jgi:cell division protein FtsN
VQVEDGVKAATEARAVVAADMAKATTAQPDDARPADSPTGDATQAPSDANSAAKPGPPTISHPITEAGKRRASAAATTTAPGTTGYEIQLGAFGTMVNASKVRDSVLGEFPGARIDPITVNGATLFRVRVGPFATGRDASEAEERLRARGFSPVRYNASAKAG